MKRQDPPPRLPSRTGCLWVLGLELSVAWTTKADVGDIPVHVSHVDRIKFGCVNPFWGWFESKPQGTTIYL